MSDIFPFKVGQKVVCIRGLAGFQGYNQRHPRTGETYRVTDVTPNYVAVATLDGSRAFNGLLGNWRFTEEPEEPEEKPDPSHDPVRHPSHYTDTVPGIECIDVVKHLNFCRGNAVKYIWRAGAKGDAVEDLRKAVQNLEFEIARLESEES